MVMKCFLSALEYLAQNKIVHRDLKPENLILAKRGDDNFLKIADFGLACILSEEEKKLYLRCGSPGYVSPELLNDKGYDCQADVFSAGVIMYVMLTGRPLFRGDNINEILERNRNCSLQFTSVSWDCLSPEAKDLVQKLLIADPDKRMTPTEALAHPWFSEPQEKLAGRVIERQGEFKIRDENEINSKAAGNLLVM